VAPKLNAPVQLRVHGSIAREIGQAIVSGRLRPGHVLAGEVEASAKRRVSRTAYREAIRILCAKGLIHSRPRTGTRVSRISDWHLLDPDVLTWLFSGNPKPEVLHGLFELRTIVEPAAAALAATRRNQEHLADMRRALDAMAFHSNSSASPCSTCRRSKDHARLQARRSPKLRIS
jgi:DNA-binding FadR family transcriptional regulator